MSRHRRSAVSMSLVLTLLTSISVVLGWPSSSPMRAEPFQDSAGGGWNSVSEPDDVDWSEWKDIEDLLFGVHARIGIPAIAAAFVKDGKIVDHATVGVHEFGSLERVESTAPFHLGSVTKSFTATVIGKLVEDGKLSWNSTVSDVLPGFEMHDAYRDVTLEGLLQHRSGLKAYTTTPQEEWTRMRGYDGTATQKREAFLADVLVQAPEIEPGKGALYSNAGYVLAGHMAETVADMSWEELVELTIFEPLSMESGGFGFPESPRGHAGSGPKFVPVPDEAYPPMELMAPAGNIHCAVEDLSRYAISHLVGLGGEADLLRPQTVRRLHSIDGVEGTSGHASGWMVTAGIGGGGLHSHGGSAGASYAEIKLYPALRCGTVVLMNVGPSVGERVADKISRSLLARFMPSALDAVSPTDVVVEDDASPEEDSKYWRVIQRLSMAINDEDRDAYDALFKQTAQVDRSHSSVFDFMAKSILPRRGGVHSFHDLGPPIRVPGSKFPMRTITFHLEDGCPGYFGISLTEEGKIDEFSLFVKSDLCPNGADRGCDKNVRNLGEDFGP